ncbi:hypothetical protein [uncultured Kordia sp.]|uniref:hypothetical protein n=1 Tax=uncultured Kordia sp. TaxID=507699 RepID=UPI0026189429|nr:hypothetical protein [uncultured Kordia sp.]
MGVRIHFYKNNSGKEIEDLILEHYSDYAQWYVNRNEASIEEFDEIYGTVELIDFFSNNKTIDNNINHLDKKIVDEMTVGFVVEYSEYNKVLEGFGPMMNKWRYQKSTKLVLETKDDEFIKLWKYLIYGRSLKASEEFNSYTNDYKIGFLSFKEHSKLEELIIDYFGDLEGMKEKYWTDSEKEELEIAIQNSVNGVYSLSDHNPITSGLEYVLEALNEMKTGEMELITVIE